MNERGVSCILVAEHDASLRQVLAEVTRENFPASSAQDEVPLPGGSPLRDLGALHQPFDLAQLIDALDESAVQAVLPVTGV